eukprot:Hpha_TRINITY_DN17458_c0_g1::TRINITY_DN17458_c0_g1_i1::g.85771::m.85771
MEGGVMEDMHAACSALEEMQRLLRQEPASIFHRLHRERGCGGEALADCAVRDCLGLPDGPLPEELRSLPAGEVGLREAVRLQVLSILDQWRCGAFVGRKKKWPQGWPMAPKEAREAALVLCASRAEGICGRAETEAELRKEAGVLLARCGKELGEVTPMQSSRRELSEDQVQSPFDVAVRASLRSAEERPQAAHGAALTVPGESGVLSVGWNRKPPPGGGKRSRVVHAEMHALEEAGDAARGGECWIVEHPGRHGVVFGYSQPCPQCTQGLIRAGVNKVHHTTPFGVVTQSFRARPPSDAPSPQASLTPSAD